MPDLPDETRSGAYTSVADIFEEVEEQLRSDRYIAIVKKTWPYAAAVAGAARASPPRRYETVTDQSDKGLRNPLRSPKPVL